MLLWWDEALFRNLKRRLSVLAAQELDFLPLRDADVAGLLAEVDRDRERLQQLLQGEPPRETRELLRTSLFVVESPNKARTIASLRALALEVDEVLVGTDSDTEREKIATCT